MAADTDLLFDLGNGVAQRQQNFLKIRLQLGAATGKHRPVLGIDNLDTQAVLGDFDQNLILEALQHRLAVDLVLQLLQQHFHIPALSLISQFARGVLADVLLPGFLRCLIQCGLGCNFRGAAQIDRPGTAAFVETDRVVEVAGDTAQLLRGGNRNQPHDQKEGHHRYRKVGKGDLP